MLLLALSMLVAAGTTHPAGHYGASTVVQPARQVAAPTVQCRTEYVTLWDTEYQEKEEQVCNTVYEKQCHTRTQRLCQPTTRQECHQEYEQQCATVYNNVCVQKYRTEYEPYTESECTTEYKEDCQYEWKGAGNDKVWAPIEGTCQNVPYDKCKEVTKTHAKQVAYQECSDVPEKKCTSVPKQVCVNVTDQVCTSEPLTECQDVPKEACRSEHKKYPLRISRKEAKKVCDTTWGQAKTSPTSLPTPPAPSHKIPSPSDPAPPPSLPSNSRVELPIFTAPKPVPSSPVLSSSEQGSPSPPTTLDAILAARKANTPPEFPNLSEKLVFSS